MSTMRVDQREALASALPQVPSGTIAVLALPALVVVAAFGQAVFGDGYADWVIAPAALGITLWNLLPIAGMAALLLLVVRRWPRGLSAARVGVVVLSAITAYSYWWLIFGPGLANSSWHSGLLSLILPVYLWVVVAATAGLSLLTHRWRHGTRPRRGSAGRDFGD